MYLDYKTSDRDYYVIDIECDSLTPTIIWCLCWQNVKTRETGECIGHDAIQEWFRQRHDAIFLGHNILKFDAPVLVRLVGAKLSVRNCIDTLVLSTLYSPSINGGHSLGAWGERLGKAKGDFTDFSRFSDEMLVYCHQDVAITCELYKRLVQTLNRINFSEKSVWIQHHFTVLLEKQRQNGFYFDGRRALELFQTLRTREAELEDIIRGVFPGEKCRVATRQMYKRDGSFTAIFEKDQLRYDVEASDDGTYNAFEYVEFNVGSPKQRVEKLVDLGWEPAEFTDAGNPKPFDKGKLSPSLEAFLEKNPTPEVELIARWMSVNGRANMIGTWLDNWNDTTGCIHGKLFVADTLRLRHQAPNTANIPAVRTQVLGKGTEQERVVVRMGEDGYYTYEARDLWCARPGRILVGTDAAGLELRMLAHYLNRPEFTEQVVSGDPHQYNADLVGITRPQAKTLIYAVLYGAAALKISKTLGVPVKEAAKIRQLFLDKLGVGRLIDECKQEQQQGRVELVDGSMVICPSPHAALNYKLQGGGARVMALSAVLADREVRKNRWDVLKVGDIHDEDQSDCDPVIAEDFGKMRVRTIIESGRLLKMNVPLDGTYKLGRTWSETH